MECDLGTFGYPLGVMAEVVGVGMGWGMLTQRITKHMYTSFKLFFFLNYCLFHCIRETEGLGNASE